MLAFSKSVVSLLFFTLLVLLTGCKDNKSGTAKPQEPKPAVGVETVDTGGDTSKSDDTTDPAKSSDATDTQDPVKTGDAIDPSDPEKPGEAVGAGDTAKSGGTTDPEDTAEVGRGAGAGDTAMGGASADTGDVGDSGGAVEASESAETKDLSKPILLQLLKSRIMDANQRLEEDKKKYRNNMWLSGLFDRDSCSNSSESVREGISSAPRVNKLLNSIKDRIIGSLNLDLKKIGIHEICISTKVFGLKDSSSATLNGGITILLQDVAKFQTEEGSAFLLAHEIAHILLRHAYFGVIEEFEECGEIDYSGTCLESSQKLQQSSVVREKEADHFALWLMKNAGFSLENASEIFVIQGLGLMDDRLKKVLLTHPARKERLVYSETLTKELMRNGDEGDSVLIRDEVKLEVANDLVNTLPLDGGAEALAINLIIGRAERQYFLKYGQAVESWDELQPTLRHCKVKGWQWRLPHQREYWSSLLSVAIRGRTDTMEISCKEGAYGLFEVTMSMSRALSSLRRSWGADSEFDEGVRVAP